MDKREPITVTGQPVTADIESWSLSIKNDPLAGQRHAASLATESATITGFWGPEDEICLVCERGVDTSEEAVATITTDADPEEFLGIACRDCVLKALEGAD